METQENSWCGNCTKAGNNLVHQLHSSLPNEINGSVHVQLDRSLQLQLDQSLQLQQQCSMLRLGQMMQTFSGQQSQLQLLQQQISALQLQVQSCQKQTNNSAYHTEPRFHLHSQCSYQSAQLPSQKQMTSGVRPYLNKCPPQTCLQHLKPDLVSDREQVPQPPVPVSTQSMSSPSPDVFLNVGATSSRPIFHQGVASTFLNCSKKAMEEPKISFRNSQGMLPHLPETGSNGKFVKDSLGRHDIACKASNGQKESECLQQKDLCSAMNHNRINNKDGLHGSNSVGEKRFAGLSAKERTSAAACLDKLYSEACLDKLYSEAVSLIAKNERQPWFLLWMIQKMRQIQTECQWQTLARLIHNLVVASADAALSLHNDGKNLARCQENQVFYRKTQFQKNELTSRQNYEVLRDGKINNRLTKQAKKTKNKSSLCETYSKTVSDIVQSKPTVCIELGKVTEDIGQSQTTMGILHSETPVYLEHSQSTMDASHSQTSMDASHSQSKMNVDHSQSTINVEHSQTETNLEHSQVEQEDKRGSAGFKLDEEETLDRKWRYKTLARSCVCGGCPLATGTGVPELNELHWTDGVEKQIRNNLTNFRSYLDGTKLAEGMFSPPEDTPAYPGDAKQVQEEDTIVNPHVSHLQGRTEDMAISVAEQGSPTLEDKVKELACPQELEPEGESVSLPSCVLCGILVLSLSAAAVLFLGRVIVRHFLQSPSLN